MASPPPAPPPIPKQCGIAEDYFACMADPTYISTGSSGCCPGGIEGWVAGVCDLCTQQFTCRPPITGGFKWGACVAVVVNIGISFGMALQKAAHTRVEQRVAASAKISDEAAAAEKKKGFTSEYKWWVGFLMQVSGEIGNLVAYGDPNTPASVVASLGCVAVVANSAISTIFLGEGCKRSDGIGIAMIVTGVILIIEFVPRNPKGGTTNLLPCPIAFRFNYSAAACELPASWPGGDTFESPHVSGVMACDTAGLLAVGSDYWYFVQPEWLSYLLVMLLLFGFFYAQLKRTGPKHCASYLVLADIAGGFTVCASVTISTFLFTLTLSEGKFYVMLEPIFWLCVLILAATLPVQVNYLNKALAEYDASVVVPTHYVLFTLASIGAPSVLYQELTLNEELLGGRSPVMMLGLFLFGIICTCAGVIIVSSGHGKEKNIVEFPLVEAFEEIRDGILENAEAGASRTSDENAVEMGQLSPPRTPSPGEPLGASKELTTS